MIHPPAETFHRPDPLVPGLPRDWRRWAVEVAQVVVSSALLYLVVNSFVAQPFEVELRSMQPTLAAGDHILVDKVTPRWDDYARGDIVVFDAPAPYDADGVPYVKRVIGLPGDTVEIVNGRVYVTPPGGLPTRVAEPYLTPDTPTMPQGVERATTWVVPEGTYFVMGDNRSESVDSRTFDPIPRDRILGRAWLRYLPLDRIGLVGGG